MLERTVSAPVSAPRAPTRAEIKRFFAAALDASGGAREASVITVPVPRSSLATFLAASALPHGSIWHPPAGKPAFAGAGAAACIRLNGPERLADLRARAADLFTTLAEHRYPGCRTVPPRLFGGLAFAPGGSSG